MVTKFGRATRNLSCGLASLQDVISYRHFASYDRYAKALTLIEGISIKYSYLSLYFFLHNFQIS
jgi:hypothetical protein